MLHKAGVKIELKVVQVVALQHLCRFGASPLHSQRIDLTCATTPRSSSWCFTPVQQMESTLMRVAEEMTSTDQSHSQQGRDWFIPLGKNQGFKTNLHRIDPLLWQSPTESVWEVWNIPIWWDTEKGEVISVSSFQHRHFRVCVIWHWNIHFSWEDFWQYSTIPVSLMSSATLRMNSFPNGLYIWRIGDISSAAFHLWRPLKALYIAVYIYPLTVTFTGEPVRI